MGVTSPGSIIRDTEGDPLSQNMIDYLMAQKRESSYLDFKKTLSISKNENNEFPKLVKDALAFSNYGGGYVLVGFQQNDHTDEEVKGKHIPVGLPEGFSIDQASLQEKINSYLNAPLEIGYVEFQHEVEIKMKTREIRNFAIIYFPPGIQIMTATKDGHYLAGDKPKVAFKKGDIFIRRGTQSVPASQYEIDYILRRSRDDRYKLSVINGMPDELEETLYSNLFEIIALPKYVWVGGSRYQNYIDMKEALRNRNPKSNNIILRCKYWNGQIISFVRLSDPSEEYSHLVRGEVVRENLASWLKDADKRRIIIELLKYEIISFAIRKGLFYNSRQQKLFYATNSSSRTEEWPTRYSGLSKKIVSNKVYSTKLHQHVFWHVAISPSITSIGEKVYLNLYPTFIITSNGRHSLEGMRQGTLITSLQYNKYNDQYLNNLLFWSKKLSDGADKMTLSNGLVVSSEPVSTKIDKGIRWDIPASEVKNFIESYDQQHPTDDYEIGLLEDQEQLEF